MLSVLALLVAGATWVGYQGWHVYRAIHDTTGHAIPRTTAEPTITIPPLDSNQRINVLVLGSDNDRKKEEARPLTQSMIVVTIDPLHDKVGMLSIPRDFYVPIRGHGMAKIDLASKYGGIGLARETVERMFGIQIHYYAWVGLGGFVRVINTFNGVTLDITHPILDDFYPNDLRGRNPYAYKRVFIPPGWQHMTGQQALEYVRSRHGDLIGDFGRSARQQQILLQLEQKINAMNVLLNLPRLADDLDTSVVTDFGMIQLYQLAQLARHIHRQDVTQVVLQAPTFCNYGWTTDGQSILVPNWKVIRPVVARLFAPIAAPSKRPAARPSRGATRPTATRTPATPLPGATSGPTPVRGVTATPVIRPTPTPTPPSQLPGNLLYVSDGNIFELSAGGQTRQLTWGGDAAMPNPAPGGRWVAFVRFTVGLHRYNKYASDVWLLDLATLRQHVMTHDDSPQPPNNLWAAWPGWTWDGRWLTFSTDRAKLSQTPSEIRPVDLAVWRMPARGGNAVQLTTPDRGSGGDTEPSWRPNSSQLLYVKWSYLQPSNQPYSQLVLLDTRTGRATPLTPVGETVLDPQWDRAGRRVVFIRKTNGVDQVEVAPLEQIKGGPALGPATVLAHGEVAQPAFSPGGAWVSYLRGEGNGFGMYTIAARGGSPRKVDGVPSSVDARWRPVWIP